jgi:hypothetical protein
MFIMFRTFSMFSLVGLIVALAASPALAQVGVAGNSGQTSLQKTPTKGIAWGGPTMINTAGTIRLKTVPDKRIICTPDVVGPIGAKKADSGTAQQKGASTATGPVELRRLDKSSPLILHGLLNGDPAKRLVPGPVPLKEQMKGRFKSRLKNDGN